MEEITFMDALTHYQTKLSQLGEEIEQLRHQLHLSRVTMDEAWKGPAAESCKAKLDGLHRELSRTLSDLSDARAKLSIVADLWEEEQLAPLIPPTFEG